MNLLIFFGEKKFVFGLNTKWMVKLNKCGFCSMCARVHYCNHDQNHCHIDIKHLIYWLDVVFQIMIELIIHIDLQVRVHFNLLLNGSILRVAINRHKFNYKENIVHFRYVE